MFRLESFELPLLSEAPEASVSLGRLVPLKPDFKLQHLG